MPNSRKQVLRGLADNKELFAAVKETVLEQFVEGIILEELLKGMPNELLGQITRARLVGRLKVEEAFRAIASCASVEKSTNSENPAY